MTGNHLHFHLHLRDLGNSHRFHMHWPRLDTTTWPGREAHWAFTHPALAGLLFIVAVIVLGGFVHDLVL